MIDIKKLAEDHWNYVNGVLETHGAQEEERDIIKFHYISAFIHGFKHAKEEYFGTN